MKLKIIVANMHIILIIVVIIILIIIVIIVVIVIVFLCSFTCWPSAGTPH